MAKDKGKCKIPNCQNPAKTRGLCSAHYWTLNKSPDSAKRARMAKYANAPTRGPNKDKPPKEPGDEKLMPPPQTPNLHSPAGESPANPTADAARAATDDAFRLIGAKSVPIPSHEGMLYILPTTPPKAVFVNDDGMQQAKITIGENSERIV